MKVLIVEDDESILYLMDKIVCKHLGHECFKAPCMEVAKGLLRGMKPDVILLDLVMGGQDGAQIVHLARELYGAHPQIVIVSAKSGLQDIAEKLECKWLSKPFDITELEQALRSDFAPKRKIDGHERANK